MGIAGLVETFGTECSFAADSRLRAIWCSALQTIFNKSELDGMGAIAADLLRSSGNLPVAASSGKSLLKNFLTEGIGQELEQPPISIARWQGGLLQESSIVFARQG